MGEGVRSVSQQERGPGVYRANDMLCGQGVSGNLGITSNIAFGSTKSIANREARETTVKSNMKSKKHPK